MSIALAVWATAALGATLVVDPDGPIRTVAEAARLAQDDDVVEIRSGEYRGDVAVWLQKRLTIRGVGPTRPVMHAEGRSAEGKAIWVLRDGAFDIENIAFEGARVPNLNGAGVRFERGRLTLRRCRFTDDEMGMLTGNDADSELTVEDSEFAHAPRDRGPRKHLLLSDLEADTSFLRVWPDRLPTPRIVAINNLTVGRGTFAPAAGDRFEGNRALPLAAMRDARALDFRLRKRSPLRGTGVAPPVIAGHSLAPDAEFALPLGTRPIRRLRAWTPGAFQTPK